MIARLTLTKLTNNYNNNRSKSTIVKNKNNPNNIYIILHIQNMQNDTYNFNPHTYYVNIKLTEFHQQQQQTTDKHSDWSAQVSQTVSVAHHVSQTSNKHEYSLRVAGQSVTGESVTGHSQQITKYVSQSIAQHVSQSASQSVSQSVHRSIGHTSVKHKSISQYVSQSITQSVSHLSILRTNTQSQVDPSEVDPSHVNHMSIHHSNIQSQVYQSHISRSHASQSPQMDQSEHQSVIDRSHQQVTCYPIAGQSQTT